MSLAWLAAAVILLIGALLGVFTRRDRLWLPLPPWPRACSAC